MAAQVDHGHVARRAARDFLPALSGLARDRHDLRGRARGERGNDVWAVCERARASRGASARERRARRRSSTTSSTTTPRASRARARLRSVRSEAEQLDRRGRGAPVLVAVAQHERARGAAPAAERRGREHADERRLARVDAADHGDAHVVVEVRRRRRVRVGAGARLARDGHGEKGGHAGATEQQLSARKDLLSSFQNSRATGTREELGSWPDPESSRARLCGSRPSGARLARQAP